MRKHLSVLALAARGAVCRVVLVTLLSAALAGALLYLVPAREPTAVDVYPNGNTVTAYTASDLFRLPAKTGAAAVCAAGFAAVLAVLSFNGCGAQSGLTMQRLRISEGAAELWWVLLNAVCLLFYWAVMAAVFTAVLRVRIAGTAAPADGCTPGPQTLLLNIYAGSFLHHLMPLRDATVWVENLLLTALCAAAAARFSHARRRGRFSAAPLIALVLTIGSFFFPLGAGTTILVCLAAAAALGFTVLQFLKGETDDEENRDFHAPQDP